MAQKNWLIRTRHHQILGPATKQKIIELIEKGSLGTEDEITSGNGYWFRIKEKDLLEKYIYGEQTQGFNPITEADNVLTVNNYFDNNISDIKTKSIDDDVILPKEEDLEYPDIDAPISAPINTMPEGPSQLSTSINQENSTAELDLELEADPGLEEDERGHYLENETKVGISVDKNALFPDHDDLDYPDMDINENSVGELELAEIEEDEAQIDDRTGPRIVMQMSEINEDFEEGYEDVEEHDDFYDDEVEVSQEKKDSSKKRSLKRSNARGNDRYLIYIVVILVIVIGVIVYYYKNILNKPLPLVGISSAHAQVISSLSKKKT